MSNPVSHVPQGYHTATPYLIVRGAARAIAFYEKAFGAKELFRMGGPDGKIGHAEIMIGDSHIMMADEEPMRDARSPESLGGSPMFLMLYVPDVDAMFQAAVAGGAKATMPVSNQFYGDRSGMLTDPFGHKWCIATHIEDVPPEEMERRAAAAMAQQKK